MNETSDLKHLQCYALIGGYKRPREPGEVTHARRFARRAQQHGIRMQPHEWGEMHVIVRWADRIIRINRDGHMTQSQHYGDPHWRGTATRVHHYDLVMARRGRLWGLPGTARSALALAARDRRQCAPLPA